MIVEVWHNSYYSLSTWWSTAMHHFVQFLGVLISTLNSSTAYLLVGIYLNYLSRIFWWKFQNRRSSETDYNAYRIAKMFEMRKLKNFLSTFYNASVHCLFIFGKSSSKKICLRLLPGHSDPGGLHNRNCYLHYEQRNESGNLYNIQKRRRLYVLPMGMLQRLPPGY